MDSFSLVFRQVLILFALMGVGALARRFKWVDEASAKGMVNLLVVVVTPCLVVGAFQRPFEAAMMKHLGLTFVVVAAVHALAIALAYLFIHGGRTETRHPDL